MHTLCIFIHLTVHVLISLTTKPEPATDRLQCGAHNESKHGNPMSVFSINKVYSNNTAQQCWQKERPTLGNSRKVRARRCRQMQSFCAAEHSVFTVYFNFVPIQFYLGYIVPIQVISLHISYREGLDHTTLYYLQRHNFSHREQVWATTCKILLLWH